MQDFKYLLIYEHRRLRKGGEEISYRLVDKFLSSNASPLSIMNITEEINKIDSKLEVMRREYVTASVIMRKYLLARAQQLKDKQKRLRHEIENKNDTL